MKLCRQPRLFGGGHTAKAFIVISRTIKLLTAFLSMCEKLVFVLVAIMSRYYVTILSKNTRVLYKNV